MSETLWRQRYAAALELASARAAAARQSSRLIACAFTSNVDRVGTLDDALVERLFAGKIISPDLPRVARVRNVADLLTGIAQCIAAGDGTDLVVRDAEVQAWLLQRMPGRIQIGGTGVQAASTLATLGFPVVVHLTGRSPLQIEALAHRERIWLGTADGLTPVEGAENPADETMWHPALEFAEGLRAPMPGRPAAPAANRVLIGYDPVNADFQIDPGFSAALRNPALDIATLLISGFTQLHEEAIRSRVLRDAAAALHGWREARPDLFVHLELGAMPDFRMVAEVVQTLHPLVSSIGMNIDELRAFLAVHGVEMAAPGPELASQMRQLSAHYPTRRFSVHTREYCLTLTENDPEQEAAALLFGSLTAASRSRIAAFPELPDLAATLAKGTINPDGLSLLHTLGADSHGHLSPGVVATPGIAFHGPAATVGLGDSFTGGILAML